MIPKVAVMNDLSGMGRCSLTAALPILSCMGAQPCPLPTAILSGQTGYPEYFMEDLTASLGPYLQKWHRMAAGFDGIYTGFLTGERQLLPLRQLVRDFRKPDTLLLVDPVMADHGSPYPSFSKGLCMGLKELVSQADIATPNLTEACLLTDTPYDALMQHKAAPDFVDRVIAIGEALIGGGARAVAITGVVPDNAQETPQIGTVLVWRGGQSVLWSQQIGDSFSGTGDVFASVVCGGCLQGMSLEAAARLAVRFIEKVLQKTARLSADRNDGIAFEPYLSTLWEEINHA